MGEASMKAVKILMIFSVFSFLPFNNAIHADSGCEGKNVLLSSAEKEYHKSVVNKIYAILAKVSGYNIVSPEKGYPAEDYYLDCDNKKHINPSKINVMYLPHDKCQDILNEADKNQEDEDKYNALYNAYEECEEKNKSSDGMGASIFVFINQNYDNSKGEHPEVRLEHCKRITVAGVDNAFQDENKYVYLCIGNWVEKETYEKLFTAQIPADKINITANIIIIVQSYNDTLRQDILKKIDINAIKALITK
jgi:hypothetical protein